MKTKKIKYLLIGAGTIATVAIVPASVVACGSTSDNNNNNNGNDSTNSLINQNIASLNALSNISALPNLTVTAQTVANILKDGSNSLNSLSQYFNINDIVSAAVAGGTTATYTTSASGTTLTISVKVSVGNNSQSTNVTVTGFPTPQQILDNLTSAINHMTFTTNTVTTTPLEVSNALGSGLVTLTQLNNYFNTASLANLLNNSQISNPTFKLTGFSSNDGTINITIGGLSLGTGTNITSVPDVVIVVSGFSSPMSTILAALNYTMHNMIPSPVPQTLPSFFTASNLTNYIPVPKPYGNVTFTIALPTTPNANDNDGTIKMKLTGSLEGVKKTITFTLSGLYSINDVINTAKSQITIKSSVDAINTLPSLINTTSIDDTFSTPPASNGFTFSIKYPKSDISDDTNGSMNVTLIINPPNGAASEEQTISITGFATYTSVLNKTLAGITSLSLVKPNSVLLPSFVSNDISSNIATPSFDNLSGAISSDFSIANVANAIDNVAGTLTVSLNLTIGGVTISKNFTITLTNVQDFLADQLKSVSDQVTPNATGFTTLPSAIISAGNESLSQYVNIPSTITPQGTFIVFSLQINTIPSTIEGNLDLILTATWVSGSSTFVNSINLAVPNFLKSSSNPIQGLLNGINSLIDTNNIKAKLSVLFSNVNSSTIGNSITGVPINSGFTYSYQDFSSDSSNNTVSFKIGITDNANTSSTQLSKIVTLTYPSSMQEAVDQMASAINVSKIINNSSSNSTYSYYVNNGNIANYITGLPGLDSGFSYTYSVGGNGSIINSALTGSLTLTIGIQNTIGQNTTTSTTSVSTTIYNFLEGTVNKYDPNDTSIPVQNIDGISDFFNSAIIVPKGGTITAFKEAAINPNWAINGTYPGWLPGSANLANVIFVLNGRLWGGQPQIAWSYWPNMESTSNDTPKPPGQNFIYVRIYNPNGPGSGASTNSGWFGIKATGFAS